MCDCGHPFDELGAHVARSSGFVPYGESHRPGPSGAAKLGVGVLGFLVGFLPLELRAVIRSGDSHSDAWMGFGVLAGFGGAVIALGLLRKVHERRSSSRRQDR